MKQMTLKIVTTLALVFPLMSQASASEEQYRCSGTGEDATLSATLLNSDQFGWIAILTDGYDTALRAAPGPNETSWMPCFSQNGGLRCVGEWEYSKFGDNSDTRRRPVEAIFNGQNDNSMTVSFPRSPLFGGYQVSLDCEAVK